MKIYNYSDAQQNFAAVLNTALTQDVIVKRKNGQQFKIIPVKENMNQSPFDVLGINASITTEEIVKTLKQSRTRIRHKPSKVLIQ